MVRVQRAGPGGTARRRVGRDGVYQRTTGGRVVEESCVAGSGGREAPEGGGAMQKNLREISV